MTPAVQVQTPKRRLAAILTRFEKQGVAPYDRDGAPFLLPRLRRLYSVFTVDARRADNLRNPIRPTGF